jgi:hypothetical protein
MKPQSQIEISAQVWECTSCGGRDPKSCGCNSTAIMVALREAADKHANRKEIERQRIRRKRADVGNADVENTKESDNGSAVEKPGLAHADLPDRDGEVIGAILVTVSQMHQQTRKRLFDVLRQKFSAEFTAAEE